MEPLLRPELAKNLKALGEAVGADILNQMDPFGSAKLRCPACSSPSWQGALWAFRSVDQPKPCNISLRLSKHDKQITISKIHAESEPCGDIQWALEFIGCRASTCHKEYSHFLQIYVHLTVCLGQFRATWSNEEKRDRWIVGLLSQDINGSTSGEQRAHHTGQWV